MYHKNTSDQDLLRGCREGSEAAFKILFRRYFDDLLQFAAQRLNNRELAEELVMDLMLKLWQKNEDAEEIQQLGQYLFRSIKNAVISHWRKKALETTSLEALSESDVPSAPAADYQVACEETEKIYRDKLSHLSSQRRLVFILSREENLSNVEIAQATDLSVHTVKNHLKAALHYFRKHLERL